MSENVVKVSEINKLLKHTNPLNDIDEQLLQQDGQLASGIAERGAHHGQRFLNGHPHGGFLLHEHEAELVEEEIKSAGPGTGR